MATITLNEGLSWQKTLKTRLAELVQLRNASAKKIVALLVDTLPKI